MIELLQAQDAGRPALVDCDAGSVVTYDQLAAKVSAASRQLQRDLDRALVLLVCTNTIDSIVLYLACLESRFPVCLLEPYGPAPLRSLVERYRPGLLLLPSHSMAPPAVPAEHFFAGTRYCACHFSEGTSPSAMAADLALMLSTSGSTGTPKFVRLTLNNILANARSIISYLGLSTDERGIQSLAMHYSYGLSVVNSHLLAGATLVLTPHAVFSSEFWGDFDRWNCSSFAGVPYTFEGLLRLQFDPVLHPSLRTITQAGGALRPELIQALNERVLRAGARFFVMYGQTEATARISYVPPERLAEKAGSIGVPIPQGRMEMAHVDGHDCCELVYTGPNVMMGYSESAADLALGDELNGVLHTGDLVRSDPEGFYYLTGRLKRFAKLFGRRISLLDVENQLEAMFPIRAAVIEHGQQLRIFFEANESVDPTAVCQFVARTLHVPPKFIPVGSIPAMPVTVNGKKDYKALCS